MIRQRRGPVDGFTLAEAMIAMLFISIALFGYVSLHIRIIYSGTKLEQRQDMHEAVCGDLVTQMAATRLAGNRASPSSSTGVMTSGSAAGSKGSGPIPYTDSSSTTTLQGLPPNLFECQGSRNWTDRNGQQAYFVDSYERGIVSGW